MERRLELHAKLTDLTSNVYFQPPENVKLKYPCIVYERSTGDHLYANDMTYRFTNRYDVTIISRDPDDSLLEQFAYAFPMARHSRFYAADNLNHDVFNLFY